MRSAFLVALALVACNPDAKTDSDLDGVTADLDCNDLDDTVNPVEGTLLWTIGPKDTRRRTEQGFPGAANMLTAEGKPKKFGRKRVGFMGHTKPARPGADIYSADGTTKVGTVATSEEIKRRGADSLTHWLIPHRSRAAPSRPASTPRLRWGMLRPLLGRTARS